MWTRKELKENAKIRFKANYWKAVLAALILGFVLSGGSNFNYNFNDSDIRNKIEDKIDDFGNGDADGIINETFDELEADGAFSFNGQEFGVDEIKEAIGELENDDDAKGITAIVAAVAAVVMVIVIVAMVIGVAFQIFLKNPLEVGGRKFFVVNHSEDAIIKNFGHAFSGNYLNIVLTMFLRDLYTFLWALLFVIPGIIKAYEYRMIPYLLAENPEMKHEEAFNASKNLMMGNKWNAFVLDLSFIGWNILNVFTLGILGIFYVNPYKYQTDAELYIRLVEDSSNPTATIGTYESYVEVQ